MQKRTIIIGGVILAAAAALVALPMLQGNPGIVAAQDRQTAAVERTTLSSTIETTGTIAPEETVYLSFGISGAVSEVLVEVGEEVTAGTVLARLDTRELENQIARQEQSLIVQQTSYDQLVAEPTAQEIAQAEANLASAQSQLQQAQNNLSTASNNSTINCSSLTSADLDLQRAQDAYDDYVNDGYQLDATFIPDPDSSAGEALRNAQSAYDVAQAQCGETTPTTQLETAVTAAQASVDQAQAALDDLLNGPSTESITSAQAQLDQAMLELENARAGLADAVITAPFDGIISEINIARGQLTNTASTAITIVDHSELHVDVSVDELDIAQIAEGQPALILPEALDGVEIEGVVTRIAPTSSSTDGVVTYDVRVDISNEAALPIRIGMTTDVQIQVGSLEDVLVLPTEAIQRDGQNEFVEVLNADNTTTRVAVTTGQTIDGLTVVEGDLTEGTLVVVPQQTTQAGGAGLPFGGGN
jgi:HlyD family secretion protein